MSDVLIAELTDDNREAFRDMALSMYLGEECQGCGKVYETLEELKDTVWWPWEKGRIGCKGCFDKSGVGAAKKSEESACGG